MNREYWEILCEEVYSDEVEELEVRRELGGAPTSYEYD